MKENEMGRAYGTHGRDEDAWEFGDNMKERANLEDVGIDRKKILKCILKKYVWKA
jgi:hypothetical protein